MAVPTNTHLTFAAIGNREDLTDKIALVAPTATPFWSNIRRDRPATATTHEWQTQALAAAANNAVLEGDDATTDAAAVTVRVNNRTQISDKVARVSGTQETVNSAGRASEMAFQMATKTMELKRDIEFAMLSNAPSVAGAAGTARKSGGIQTWIASNVVIGTGSAAVGGFVTTTNLTSARTAASTNTHTFAEADVKSVMEQAFSEGGLGITQAYMAGAIKQTFSGFAGVAAQRKMQTGTGMAKIIGAADVYVSDFGELSLIPNALMQTGNTADKICLFIDPTMVGWAPLRDFKVNNLAKTGDSERKQLITEWTLIVDNEKAHGAVYDIT